MDSRKSHVSKGRRSPVEVFLSKQDEESSEFSFCLEDELTPERVEDIVTEFTKFLKEMELGRGLSVPLSMAAHFGSFPILEERVRPLFTPDVFTMLMEKSEHSINDLWASMPENNSFSRFMYTFYPQRASEFQQKNFLPQRKREIQSLSAGKEIHPLYDACTIFFLLSPQERNELPVDEETFHEMNAAIQEYKEEALQQQPMPRQLVKAILEKASQLVLLHPGLKQNLALDVTVSSLGKKLLRDSSSRGDIEAHKRYLQALEQMSILAAREVRIPSPGRLEFVFDEKPSRISPLSAMPLPREF